MAKYAQLKGYYQTAFATHAADFNRCFYCGCEATDKDYCPPLSHCKSVLDFAEQSDFIAINSCYECAALLHNERVLTLNARFSLLKRKLSKKYAGALRVSRVWQADELSQMSDEFRHSIAAGMRLGAETEQRLAYAGFDYHAEQASHAKPLAEVKITIDEQHFHRLDDALDYCEAHYHIQRGEFYKLLIDKHQGDFVKALNEHQQQYAQQQFEHAFKRQISTFSRQHKQNSHFVKRACQRIMRQQPSLTIEQALSILHRDYIADSK